MYLILVVDDDQDLVSVMRRGLEMAGYTVRTASDGLEALDEVRRQRPDLILLDLMMPRLDGHATYKKLKENSDTADIPIIILTGYGQVEPFMELRDKLQVFAFLEKPSPLRLVALLFESVNERRQLERARPI